jgi:hypothetical protein
MKNYNITRRASAAPHVCCKKLLELWQKDLKQTSNVCKRCHHAATRSYMLTSRQSNSTKTKQTKLSADNPTTINPHLNVDVSYGTTQLLPVGCFRTFNVEEENHVILLNFECINLEKIISNMLKIM